MKFEVKAIIAQKVLLNILAIFTGSFFMAQLFEIAKTNLVPIVIFNIVFVLSLIVGFFCFVGMVKRGQSLQLHRIGILGYVVFLSALMLLKDNVISYLVPLGVLFGFVTEAWWLPIHKFIVDKISKDEQPKFQGYFNAITGAASIIAPLALGYLISLKSFEQAAAVMVVIAISQLVVSLVIKPPKIQNSKPLRIIDFFKTSMKNKSLTLIYMTEFLRGTFSNGALQVIIVIYAAHLFGTGLNLGIFLSVFAIISIIIQIYFARCCTYYNFSHWLYPVIIATCVVAIAFTFKPSIYTFLSYQFCFTALIPIKQSIANINFYNMSNTKSIKQNMEEFFGVRELFLNFGRIFSFILMLVISITGNFENIKFVLLFLTLCVSASGIYALVAHKQQEK
jgi:MFS family permease